MKFPRYDHPLVIRHNRRFCRIAAHGPGFKARHVRFQPRLRDIDSWRMLRGKMAIFKKRGPGPIDPLKHAIPFHMFPLSWRIEATRLRAKGETL